MSAAAVSAVAFGFVRVIVSTDGVPGVTVEGAKALATVGCASTVSVALAAAALPALVVETVPVLLRYAPADAEVTFTVTVHELLAGTTPAESARELPPLAAVTTPAPHVVAPEADAVFTRPGGYVSVNAAPLAAVAFGFVSVIVITLLSLVPIEASAKALVTVSALNTVSEPLAAATLEPAFAVASAPAGSVFV